MFNYRLLKLSEFLKTVLNSCLKMYLKPNESDGCIVNMHEVMFSVLKSVVSVEDS